VSGEALSDPVIRVEREKERSLGVLETLRERLGEVVEQARPRTRIEPSERARREGEKRTGDAR
jgi:hypothetical protein